MEIAIMVEGQNGLNWELWKNIVTLAEDSGFNGIFRSDHFTNASPPDLDSLELWVSLTWLASHTHKIEFGPLVTPLSFRNPVMTARMASAVDDLSGGRLTLGLGAGWQEREHNNFGFDLLEISDRFDRFDEGLNIITSLLKSDKPFDYSGKFYSISDAVLLPRTERKDGPPILIGGNGPLRTLPLAARFADEWNAVYLNPEKFAELNTRLNEEALSVNRLPMDIKRSMMTGFEYAKTENTLRKKVARRTKNKLSPEELHTHGLIVGTSSMAIDQLSRLAENGVQRVMLQWLDLENLEDLEHFAASVLPNIH